MVMFLNSSYLYGDYFKMYYTPFKSKACFISTMGISDVLTILRQRFSYYMYLNLSSLTEHYVVYCVSDYKH